MSSFKFYSFVIFHYRDYERKARSRPTKKLIYLNHAGFLKSVL